MMIIFLVLLVISLVVFVFFDRMRPHPSLELSEQADNEAGSPPVSRLEKKDHVIKPQTEPAEEQEESTSGTLESAKDFTLSDLAGDTVNLAELRLKGNNIVLCFFATWCPSCVRHLARLSSSEEAMSRENAVILMVSTEPKAVVEKYMREHDYHYRVLLDGQRQVSNLYEVDRIPTTFIIRDDGAIIYKLQGSRESAVQVLLEKLRKRGMETGEENITKPPSTLNDMISLDRKLSGKRRFDIIVDLWTSFIEDNPGEARAYLERGGAYYHLGKMDEAVSDAQAACDMGLPEGCALVERIKKMAKDMK